MDSELQDRVKKILFVCSNYPLSYNSTGASALNFSHLELLVKCLPQSLVVVVVLNHIGGMDFFMDPIQTRENRIEVCIFQMSASPVTSFHVFKVLGGTKALRYFYPFLNKKNVTLFEKIVREVNPDLIWTEDIIANFLGLTSQNKIPVVYGHHDNRWKIDKLRQKATVRNRVKNYLLKRVEEKFIQTNAYLVSGSTSELANYRQMNPKLVTGYFPSSYSSVVLPALPDKAMPDIVHLGTMKATANKIGLERFLIVCWPALSRHSVVIKLVGSLESAGDSLLALTRQPNINCFGYVSDLSTVMKPYDIHIIPYEHDTGGTRTRLPVALNYNQLLIAHRNACRGLEGLKHMENCLLADSLEEMTSLIEEVLSGSIEYKPIADRGKLLFEEAFTIGGQLPRMKSFLSAIIGA